MLLALIGTSHLDLCEHRPYTDCAPLAGAVAAFTACQRSQSTCSTMQQQTRMWKSLSSLSPPWLAARCAWREGCHPQERLASLEDASGFQTVSGQG